MYINIWVLVGVWASTNTIISALKLENGLNLDCASKPAKNVKLIIKTTVSSNVNKGTY